MSVGGTPAAITAGHFFGASQNDLAVANPGSGTVDLLRNDGGTFTKDSFVAAAGRPVSLAPIRLPGATLDGIAFVDQAANTLVILANDGRGSFSPVGTPLPTPNGEAPTKVVVADFDGDGIPDVAVATAGGRVGVYYGKPGGTFTPAQVYDAVFPGKLDLLAVDVTRDGRPDLVVSSPNDTSIRVLVHAGAASERLRAFYGVRKISLPTLLVDVTSGLPGRVDRTGVALASGDFNADGRVDIAVLDNLSEVYTLSSRATASPPV